MTARCTLYMSALKRERENLFAKSDNNIASNITVYNGRLPGSILSALKVFNVRRKFEMRSLSRS